MRSLLGLIFFAISLNSTASESGLVGKWVFYDSSFEVPESCLGTWYSFSSDGYFLSGGGGLEERKSYKVKRRRKGLEINTKYISNNGKKNCQGLDASYVKKNSPNKIYVRLKDGLLKLYLGLPESEVYLRFKKA